MSNSEHPHPDWSTWPESASDQQANEPNNQKTETGQGQNSAEDSVSRRQLVAGGLVVGAATAWAALMGKSRLVPHVSPEKPNLDDTQEQAGQEKAEQESDAARLFENVEAQELAKEWQISAGEILKPDYRLDGRFEAFAGDQLLPIFHPRVYQHKELLYDLAAESGFPVNVLAALVSIESGGKAESLSEAGAHGLFQVMPMNLSEYPQDQWMDPQVNSRAAMVVLGQCLGSARDLLDRDPNNPDQLLPEEQRLRYRHPDIFIRAFAMYNAGPTGGSYDYDQLSVQTQQYMQHCRRFIQVSELAAGLRDKGYDDGQIVEALVSAEVDARGYAFEQHKLIYDDPDRIFAYLAGEPIPDPDNPSEEALYQAYTDYRDNRVDSSSRYTVPQNPFTRVQSCIQNGFVLNDPINGLPENWLTIDSLPDD